MDKVINDFANMAAAIVERVILSTPGPDSPLYWTMLAALMGLLALLVIWLFLRLYSARKASRETAGDEPEITFNDVTAAAVADSQATAHHDKAAEMTRIADTPPTAAADGPATNITGSDAPKPNSMAPDKVAQPAAGFKFFKRRAKAGAGDAGVTDPEDDVFLLGLEQEMLATRQLYLDGLISKEVYVTETRALYDKAQTRMT